MWIVVVIVVLFSAQIIHATFPKSPEIVLSQTDVAKHSVFRVGQQITIECNALASPYPRYRWLKHNQTLEYDDRITKLEGRGTLLITKADMRDNDSYRCIAENDYGKAISAPVVLELGATGSNDAPRVTFSAHPSTDKSKPYQNLNVIKNSNISIDCQFSGAVTWSHNGNDIDLSSQRITQTQDKLSIAGVTFDDLGQYGCRTDKEYAETSLNALDWPPEVLAQAKQEYVTVENREVILDCPVFGSPYPSIRWSHDGKNLTTKYPYQIQPNASLAIIHPKLDHNGTYTCFANNGIGENELSVDLKLTVLLRTTVNIQNKTEMRTNLVLNQPCTVICEVIPLSDATKINWYRYETIITMDGNYTVNRNELTITNLTKEFEGKYKCEAINTYDSASDTFFLDTYDKDQAKFPFIDFDCNALSVFTMWHTEDSLWHYVARQNSSVGLVPLRESAVFKYFNHTTLNPGIQYTFRMNATSESEDSIIFWRIHETQPDVPYMQPANVTWYGDERRVLRITWNDIPEEELNGPEFRYRVYYKYHDHDELLANATIDLGTANIADSDWLYEDLEYRNTTFVIGNDKADAYVPYVFRVEALNRIGDSNVSLKGIYQAAHSGECEPNSPLNFTIVRGTITNTSVDFTWEAVPKDEMNGVYTNYSICLTKQSESAICNNLTEFHGIDGKFPIGEMKYQRSNLSPHTDYFACVKVMNVHRESNCNETRISFKTEEGLPGLVEVKSERRGSSAVILKWNRPKEPNGKLTAYNIYYDEPGSTSTLVERFDLANETKTSFQHKIFDLKQNTEYVFKISAATKVGEGRNATVTNKTKNAMEPGEPSFEIEGYKVGAEKSIKIDKLPVCIIWQPDESNPGSYFQVRHTNGAKLNLSEVIKNGTKTCINELESSTKYEIYVVSIDGNFETESKKQVITTGILNQDDSPMPVWVMGLIVSLVALLIILVVLTAYFYMQKRPKNYFEDGNVHLIEGELGLHENAYNLPYDQSYEVRTKRIKLDENPLASGEFGTVFRAEVKKIVPGQKKTTVAVKTMKVGEFNEEAFRSLTLELKILCNLGKHLNVVNLLGAVTKRYSQRQLMVILEYCEFGSLKKYLIRHQDNFAPCSLSDPDSSSDDDSDYEDDNERPMTTARLVSYSYQIANGMEYLTSKKVLHGDLAARNVLVADNDVVKICDFGLSRSLYVRYYAKKHNAKVPIHLLALESLTFGFYNIRTDVWAYGVLLYEIFSLGLDPYPNIRTFDAMIAHLRAGNRLPQPEHASDKIYEIMKSTWRDDPRARPTFAELKQDFANMMPASVVDFFAVLNRPNEIDNEERLKRGKEDFSAKMSIPTESPTDAEMQGYVSINSDYTAATYPMLDVDESIPMEAISGYV